MQSDYTKIVNRSEFCTLALTCIEQTQEMTIEEYLTTKGIEIPTSTPFTDISSLSERARKDIMAAYALNIVAGTSATTFDPKGGYQRQQAYMTVLRVYKKVTGIE